jgi:hypothetical protein
MHRQAMPVTRSADDGVAAGADRRAHGADRPRDERIDELLAQVKALKSQARRTAAPDNSAVPPSRGQKANAEPPAVERRRKGRPGVARRLAENPDATRRFFAEHCACGAALSEAGQELAKEYDHIDIPPIRPITTRRGVCRLQRQAVRVPEAPRRRPTTKASGH